MMSEEMCLMIRKLSEAEEVCEGLLNLSHLLSRACVCVCVCVYVCVCVHGVCVHVCVMK